MLALLTVTVGSLTAPLRSLEQAIASGKVTHVEIEGEMQAGGVGHAVVTIVWRADTFSRVTEVMQVRGSADTVGELPTSMAA